MEINSTARFRYGLPIFFTYLRNESRSNLDVLIEAGVGDIKQTEGPLEEGDMWVNK
jgi:hypothetical protein